jgi:hypothetical protein
MIFHLDGQIDMAYMKLRLWKKKKKDKDQKW